MFPKSSLCVSLRPLLIAASDTGVRRSHVNMLSVSSTLVSFYQTGCLRGMKFQRSEMIKKSDFPYLFIDHNAFHEIFMEGAS